MSIVKSSDPFTFHHGSSPLLLSIPHDGRKLKVGMSSKMTKQALLLPDTDWYINNLYDFSHQLEASVISADYSRYVVDLNRSSEDLSLYEDQISTGLCPLKTFSNEIIYSVMTKNDCFRTCFFERSPFEIKSLAHWLTKYLSAFKNLHAIDECHLN